MKKKCLIIFSAVIVILVVSILLVLFLKKDEKKLIDNEPSGSKIDNTNPNNDEPNNDSDVCGVVFGSLSENAFFSKNDAGKYVFCKNNKKTENVYDKIKNIIHTTDDKDCSGCLYCDNYPWYNNSKYAIVELNNKVGVVDC